MAWRFLDRFFFCLLIISLIIPMLDIGEDEFVAPRVDHKNSKPNNPGHLVLHIVTSNSIFEEAKTLDIAYYIHKKSLEQPQSSDKSCKKTNPKILTVTVERQIFIFDPAMQKVTGIARYRQRV